MKKRKIRTMVDSGFRGTNDCDLIICSSVLCRAELQNLAPATVQFKATDGRSLKVAGRIPKLKIRFAGSRAWRSLCNVHVVEDLIHDSLIGRSFLCRNNVAMRFHDDNTASLLIGDQVHHLEEQATGSASSEAVGAGSSSSVVASMKHSRQRVQVGLVLTSLVLHWQPSVLRPVVLLKISIGRHHSLRTRHVNSMMMKSTQRHLKTKKLWSMMKRRMMKMR
jgi:hypothetical protein